MYVIFRKQVDGAIIALFPEKAASQNERYCSAYNTGWTKYDYNRIMENTRPARTRDYRTLMNELRREGMDLKLIQQASELMHDRRRQSAKSDRMEPK